MKPSRTVHAILWAAQTCDRVRSALVHHAVLLDSRSATKDLLRTIAEQPESFVAEPERIAKSLVGADQELEEVVRLYFLTKQVLSHYEAQLSTLPLQIFNEMRNALDHYIRAIIVPETPSVDTERRKNHIRKMGAHLQRALLDGIKLTCAAMNERIEQTHRRFGDGAISLVNDGNYTREMTRLLVTAERCLVNAKLQEYMLGSPDSELGVQGSYLKALAAHSTAYTYFQDALPSLRWGRARFWLLKPRPLLVAILAAAIGGYLAKAAWFTTENLPFFKAAIDLINGWL